MKYKLLLIFCFSLFLFNNLEAQEGIIKYTVQKGETIIGIAQKHKVTPNDLYRLNPRLTDGLKEGDVIDIPKSLITRLENIKSSSTPSSTSPSSDKVIRHTVSAGETKFGLSRRYGVTIDELERQNPHIISMLQTGHELIISGGKEIYPQPKKEPVFYSGSTTHLVQKGETLWGISRKNGITVEELENANKDVLVGILKTGQILTIPIRENLSSVATSDNIYIVKSGETKYGLSKKFGLTIDELETLNPQIIPMLQAGHRLVISKSTERLVPISPQTEQKEIIAQDAKKPDSVSDVQQDIPKVTEEQKPVEFVEQAVEKPETIVEKTTETAESLDWIKYEVQPGETLFGLSRKTGLTVDEIVAKNPELESGLKSGMTIILPKTNEIVIEITKETPIAQEVTSKPQTISKLIESLDRVSTKKMVLIIPFEGNKFNEDYKNRKDHDLALQKSMDFYAGALIAMDSITKMGVNLNSEFAATTSGKIPDVTKKYDLKNADIIITPITEKAVLDLASEFSKQNIPVVTPNQESISGIPQNLYQAIPGKTQFREKVLKHLLKSNGKIIVVTEASKNQWLQKYPQFEVLEANPNGTIDETALSEKLSEVEKNWVVIDTERAGVILNLTNILLKESTKYQVQLASLLPKESFEKENISEMRFRVLKMTYPELIFDEKANLQSEFTTRFKKIYGVEANHNAVAGFDVTFDSLLRLFQNKNFETLAKDEITGQSQYYFDYQKYSGGGYHNVSVRLLQYDSDSNAKPVN